jgi:oxygen-independent coproporphyrinogen-3 oxidase
MDQLEASLARTVNLGADRIALFGYAHVPHLIPRQRRIDGRALPGQADRFAMATAGYAFLTARGYDPVGFDHFALPGDPLSKAARNQTLRRNFQGFTEDQAPVLIGLGASSISGFPDLLWQNEKNAGRYRMLLSQDCLPAALGVRRSVEDRRCAAVIEGLLCQGSAMLDDRMATEAGRHLAPFIERGLVTLADGALHMAPLALPYARTIAAGFDPYRQDSLRRFSSAV